MASSLQAKSGLDAEEVPPLEDVPDYDDLIESALDSLDVYQAKRADMNLHLKKVCHAFCIASVLVAYMY